MQQLLPFIRLWLWLRLCCCFFFFFASSSSSPPSPSCPSPTITSPFLFSLSPDNVYSDFDTSLKPTGEPYHGQSGIHIDSNESIWLIPDPRTMRVLNRSVGRIVYNQQIRRSNYNSLGAFPSFDTTFSFQIVTTSSSSGEGMAFFIAQDPTFPHSSASGYLGLTNDTFSAYMTPAQLEGHRFFAVEFDIFKNDKVSDVNDDHVGIDVNRMQSLVIANTSAISGLSLHQNQKLQAQIHFDACTNIVRVWLNNNNAGASTSPPTPILQTTIDPSDVFGDAMWVGLTAMSGKGSRNGDADQSGYAIYSWDFFSSAGDIENVAGGDKPSSKPIRSSSRRPIRSASMRIILGVALPLLFCVAAAALALYWWRRIRRLRRKHKNVPELLCEPHPSWSARSFSYACLKKATNNFSDTALLGEGGYSKVYKGTLPHDGSCVAIKRIKGSMEERQESSFASEVRIISSIRHRNLLQLKGWCYEKGKALLVYEYAENGSLEKLLYGKEKAEVLRSERRLKILVGVARALEYLHGGLGECVLHRDVKAANVMVNGEWEALLGDFGLTRLVSHDKMGGTMTAAGTPGYMAPEVMYTGRATAKADVYSFGILMLEMACGRRVLALDLDLPEEEMNNLVEWVRMLALNERLEDAIDSRMFVVEEEEEEQQQRASNSNKYWRNIIHLALICCSPEKERRPSMRQARQFLEDGWFVELPDYVLPHAGGGG